MHDSPALIFIYSRYKTADDKAIKIYTVIVKLYVSATDPAKMIF
jgi:hypothetical protein